MRGKLQGKGNAKFMDCHAVFQKRLAMTDKENALCHLVMMADFVILSKVREHKAKNPYFKKTKNLWILRFAQYDKVCRYDKVYRYDKRHF